MIKSVSILGLSIFSSHDESQLNEKNTTADEPA